MKNNSNSSTAAVGAQVALTPAVKRQRIEDGLNRFLTGQATDDDLAVFRDYRIMHCATADQACAFIEAATGRSVPFDVYATWSNILRYRWMQAQSGRRSTSKWSQEEVQVPAPLPLFEQDDGA